MSDETKVNSPATQNPAKSVNPPSIPTKSTRGDAGATPRCSTGGNRK